jgi:hypothetical protein
MACPYAGVTDVDPSTTYQTEAAVEPSERINLWLVVSQTYKPAYLPTVFIVDAMLAILAAVTLWVLIIPHETCVVDILFLKQFNC